MLSLAACCKYTDASPDADGEKSTLLQIAYTHYNACLRESGLQLQRLDQSEHVDAVVATARLLSAIGLAFCQIERRLGKSLADSECWAWLPLLRGVHAVMKKIEGSGMVGERLLHGRDLAPETVPRVAYKAYDVGPGPRQPTSPALEFLRQARIPSLFSLRKTLAESRSAMSVEKHTQYTQAIDLLDEVMSNVCIFPQIGSFVRVIFVWPSKLSPEFSNALTGGDRFALVIYAHWLMLTVVLEGLWIVGHMGRVGIFEIVARSGQWSEEEQALLELPRKLLSVSA